MTDLRYPPPYQKLSSVAAHFDVSENTIESWVALGQFPPPTRKIGGTRLWSWKKIQEFMEGQQDPVDDLLGRIRDGARQAAEDSDRKRGVRKRDQQVHGLGKIQEPGAVNPDKLPAQAPVG